MRRILSAVIAAVTLTASPAVAGIADSPVPLLMGEKATHVYSVPGVIHYLNLGTYFACTSTSTSSIRVAVEIFQSFPATVAANDASMTSKDIPPGGTVLFGTDTANGIIVARQLGISPNLAHGSARILSTSKSLVCTAFIADRTGNPPISMTYLTIIAKTKQKAAN